MISIICVYNNKILLDNYLLQSLKRQTTEYELILLDNTQRKFQSAAEALNQGGKQANQKYLMFVHQDVDLSSPTFLENVENILDSIERLGIAGVAGKKDSKGVLTIITHDTPPTTAGNILIDHIIEVQTLDECLVIIPQEAFNSLHFDEEVCDDWHLYAVDYCLNVTKLGLKSYVLPLTIYHYSPLIPKNLFQILFSIGPLPKGYYNTLKKVLKKYKPEVECIYTSCGDWNTSDPLIIQRFKILVKSGLKMIK
jgi:hypothetical protein